MSDGPHFSLNLRPRWQNTAEVCDNQASTVDERSDALSDALAADCKNEHITKAVAATNSLLEKDQGALFAGADIDEIRGKFAGSELAQRFVDHAELAIAQGCPSNEVVVKGLANALSERATRNARSSGEHYLRESSEYRANRMKGNMRDAISHTNFRSLAKEIMGDPHQRYQNKNTKRSGLDEGVQK